MSHPVLWPKSFFYPIGNSSAVCLTQNLLPEKSANVLLLGCGDPRNILYTLHVDPPIQRPVLDFTCVDVEPAVLARNVLLLTLIHDGFQNECIWNLFYHFKIDESSFSLLITQSKKLLNISKDLAAWQDSVYSSFLRFCSGYTLSQLRHYWELYVESESFPSAKHEQLFSCFICGFEERYHMGEVVRDASRSAGPFSIALLQILSDHFYHYWKTGIVSRATTDIAAATFINPTFVYSDSFTPSLVGDGCTVHYGSYPLQSFHLASTFFSSSATKEITEEMLVACAKLQFQEWCHTFEATLSSSPQTKVVIRFLAGDALAFCHTLSHLRNTSATTAGLYVSPWKGAELVLDGGDYDDNSCAPTSFNVIDTSNIADHVGLLNILIVTVPLLVQDSTSVLYTEILIKKARRSATTSNFIQLLCTDIPAFGLLFGISPTGNITQFTSNSQLHDILTGDAYRERIAWKVPYLADLTVSDGDVVVSSFPDTLALANVLFRIYQQMFADEETEGLLNHSRIAESIVHYNRGTFVALLALVKSKVQTEWTAVMENLIQLLQNDRKLILGTNNYQELCCQLYLRGVYCVEALDPQRAFVVEIVRRAGLFKGWEDVPPVVCLVLVVPRNKIKGLEDMHPRKLASPMFQCEVRGRTFHNIFSCVQAILGTLSIRGSGYDCEVSITEDAAGWSGTSPLVISVFVPAFNLVFDRTETRISLGLHSTPDSSRLALSGKLLGPMLTLFTADVKDKTAVHVVTNRPDRNKVVQLFSAGSTPIPASSQVSVAMGGNHVPSTITARRELHMNVGGTRNALAMAKVEHKQVSSSVIQVIINGEVEHRMVYPFPVDGVRAKVRIARKSRWIEIEAPVRQYPSFVPTDFAITSVLTRDRCPTVWNIHRVNLSLLPVIKVNRTDTSHEPNRQTSWIQPHLSATFYDREATSLKEKAVGDTLFRVKKTLYQLFVQAVEPNPKHIFYLSNNGSYTLIYLNELRMDLASHTLVADTCILSVTGLLGTNLELPRLPGIRFVISEDEISTWKHLLVAFTERCRTWSHSPTCRYAILGKVPVSVEPAENPLCGCGEGIDLGRVSEDPAWTELAPFMTRAAISPLFPIAYMETVDRRIQEYTVKISSNENTCAVCHKAALDNTKLLKCSGCKEVDYCGKECQVADWKRHKVVCKSKQR
ncbi:hypothetical protein B0H10DRAFT_1783805 [Mycena sp. CBHHK59/15]|nr:hypothetical protein B0H10DRAFT_1783805 [Mycena sp. CBHHK59/15]